jgi:transcriptional regulator with XRE-family HTH domain
MKPQKDMYKLGDLIRLAREKAGLSARKLEETSGLDHSYISKLEKGTYQNVLPASLNKLADALHLNPADLFTLAGYPVVEELPSFEP